jgi:hypothetical protein
LAQEVRVHNPEESILKEGKVVPDTLWLDSPYGKVAQKVIEESATADT